jgi:hypothetical protein
MHFGLLKLRQNLLCLAACTRSGSLPGGAQLPRARRAPSRGPAGLAACARRYVKESKVLFKVSGFADKAAAGSGAAVTPQAPGGEPGVSIPEGALCMRHGGAVHVSSSA